MKRRLEQLVNGRFEYEVPHLLLSVTEISLTLVEGHNYRGELGIGAEDGRKIQGFVTTDHQRIILAKDRFLGTVSTIEYGVDITGLEAGDVISGTITVSSSIEERQIPVTVRVMEAQLNSSVGEVGTLEEFARLASKNFREAFGLFTKPEFVKLLGGSNRQYLSLYKGMAHNPVTYQHLEEFLVSSGKKEPVKLTLDQQKKQIYSIEDTQKDTLYLYKNTWGYVRMEIEVIGDFLEVDKTVVTSEDFIGSVYGLEYIIRKEKLSSGRHYGKIIIHNVHQQLVFEIEASPGGVKGRPMELEEERILAELTRGYLDLAVHRTDYRSWYENSWEKVQALRKISGSTQKVLFWEAYLYETNEEEEKAAEVLQRMRDLQIPLTNGVEQGIYVYLAKKAGVRKISHAEMLREIQGFYRQEPNSPILLKILTEIDDTGKESLTRWLYAMEQCYEMGCTSPLLYLMAANLLLRQEGQLRRMSDFMIQVLRFTQREHLLTEELLKRAAYLTDHGKTFNEAIYRFLCKGYEQFPSDEVLEAICKLIMKGHPTQEKYFRWYALAVEHNIRITRLYEYYIETMSRDFEGLLPQAIRMYFSYSNTLSSRKKAFVYANVIRNKEADEATYESYRDAMIRFANEQILKGRMNDDYALIYREFLEEPGDPKTAKAIAEALFTRKIICRDKNIRQVVVCHNAMEKETSYPVTDRIAYVRIYSPDARILLEDEKRRRFATTVEYTEEPLMECHEMAKSCGKYQVENPGLLLHLCHESSSQMELSESNLSWYQQAASCKEFTKEYRCLIEKKLLEYYLAHERDMAVEAAVFALDDQEYARVDKAAVMKLLVDQGLYTRAFDLAEKFGYEKVPADCLLRLASHMILIRELAEEEELLYLASYVFDQGLYDEILLCYLRDYYVGPVEKMCRVWEKVKGFQMESDKLEERILTWSMFVRKYPKQDQKILESYIMQTGRETVILAYITYISIGYFMDDYDVSDQMFEYLERIYERKWKLDEICRLALLKYYAGKTELTDRQIQYAAAFLHEFNQKGLRFSFYQKLPAFLTEAYQVDDRIFVEERFSAEDKVMIHYRIGAEGKWKDEPMLNMYQGLFVKEFLLFYGEKLDYYLTVESRNDSREYPKKTICMTTNREDGMTRYQLLNKILAAKTIGNKEKTADAARVYLQQEALVHSCFKML
ncbi:MAG: DUF5717 family protein [Fusicatenibacter sp.]|nr:DUF5717 family protein [Lachnospiraceae bacterium]MDY2938199.1 DUF5717 family protein [Fusicatenibacter sp.]